MTWEYIDYASLSLHANDESYKYLVANFNEDDYSCVDGFLIDPTVTTYWATTITFTIAANKIQPEYLNLTVPVFRWKNGIWDESLVSIYLTGEDENAYMHIRDHDDQVILGDVSIDIHEPINLRILTRTPWQDTCTCNYDIIQNNAIIATASIRTENYYFSDSGDDSGRWIWYPYAILSEISDYFQYSEGALQYEIKLVDLNLDIKGDGSGYITKTPDKEFYESEDIVTCTANPSSNSYFSHWVHDSTEYTDNPLEITIGSHDSTLEAWFELHPYLFIENKQGEGTVKFNATQVTRGEYYPTGTTVIISLVPNQTYEVGSLFIDGSKVTLNNQFTYTLEMPRRDVAIVVIFKKSALAISYGISSEEIIMSNLSEISENIDAPYITQNYILSATYFIENQYMSVGDAKYLKIFDHNVFANPSNSDLYFKDKNEAKYCFKPNKFSRLGDLNSSLFKGKSDNKYQFLLRYPEISDDSTKGFNIWKQSFNPLGEYPGDAASGYEAISINMSDEWGLYNTTGRGLGINTETSASLLDCQPSSSNWYGSIGQYDYWEDIHSNSGFPAPDRKGYYQVQLWVRVDNTPYDAYTAIQNTVNNEYIVYSDNFIEKLKET